jgi:hypothetical protein
VTRSALMRDGAARAGRRCGPTRTTPGAGPAFTIRCDPVTFRKMTMHKTAELETLVEGQSACSCEALEAARFFLCTRCLRQVLICRRCDRGQIYCGKSCSTEARLRFRRDARRRYQASPPGRALHAERSRRFRARRRGVTDHGPLKSHATAPSAALAARPAMTLSRTARSVWGDFRCCRCNAQVSEFVRQDFLRKPRRRARFHRLDPRDMDTRQETAFGGASRTPAAPIFVWSSTRGHRGRDPESTVRSRRRISLSP